MPPPRQTITILARTSLAPLRPLVPARHAGSWQGRQPSEHINNRPDDDLNVHSSAANSGKADRAAGDTGGGGAGGRRDGQSSATTEADKGKQNEQAQKDHPEAPGPVIGMNDERAG
ncbi:MAG: hypothetical protein Q9163_003815, partial [Psora crenata]